MDSNFGTNPCAIRTAAILPSNPTITKVQRTENVRIAWTSLAGKSYSVEYTESIGSAFASIATIPGIVGSTSFTDSNATRLAQPTGFYRIAEAP